MAIAQVLTVAIALIAKATALAARWAGVLRRRGLEDGLSCLDDAKDKEILFLRDRVEQLQSQVEILQKQRHKPGKKPRYDIRERLLVIFHLEYFQVPRRQVTAVFGIARSSLYRWLHDIQDRSDNRDPAHNITPADIAALVWEIAFANIPWGRFRIAHQLAILGIFIAPSTVRRILQRSKPKAAVPKQVPKREIPAISTYRQIPAFYPNHVWSIDLTTVLRWGLWHTNVLVTIDHRSRRVICVCPLEGPNVS